MFIEKLDLKRFGKLKDFKAQFSKGINLIKGPNEAGKSTLVEALSVVLFEDPNSSRKEIKEKTTWGFSQGFEMNLDFTAEGTTYQLKKDFETGEFKLSKKSSGEKWEDKKKAEKIICQELGLPSKDVFLATSCVKQDELSKVSASTEAIAQKLEGLITGGKDETLASGVIEKLKEKIEDLKKTGTKDSGEIQKKEKLKEELTYELEKLKKEIETISEARTGLGEVNKALTKLTETSQVKKKKIELARGLTNAEEDIKKLEERQDELKGRLNEIQAAERTVKKLREESAEVPVIEKEDMDQVEELENKISLLEGKKLDLEKDQIEQKKEIEVLMPKTPLRKLLSITSFIITGIFVMLANLVDQQMWVVAGASGAVFLGVLIFTLLKRTQIKLFRRQIEQKKKRVEEIDVEVYQANVSLKTILKKYGTVHSRNLKTKYDAYLDVERQVKNELLRYEALLGGKSIKEIEQEIKETNQQLETLEDALKNQKDNNLSLEEIKELEKEVDELEEDKKKLEQAKLALSRQLDSVEGGIELVASLEERLEEVEAANVKLKQQIEIYQFTIEGIEEAQKKVLESAVEVLDEDTSKILNQITSGKYSKVRFNKHNLKFEVFSPEKDSWVDPGSCLSRGTLDQLYLAARIAILNLITGDKKPVLILDDPFVTFDEARRKASLAILKDLSEVYQIFLLTCHDFYDQYKDNLITISG